MARVLEARFLPPYEGSSGLGSNNAPGLVRLASSTFTGEYPLARVDFQDRALPVRVSLEAFSPFIPHEPDDSGLPVAILRYRVTNPGAVAAKVSIAWSIDNPCGTGNTRVNEHRAVRAAIEGLLMTHPTLGEKDPLKGSFALCLLDAGADRVTHLRGWEAGRWWNSPMLFWDDFSEDGELGPEPAAQELGGRAQPAAHDCAARDEGLHVPAGLAFSESHAAPVRLVGAQGRRGHRHRQSLLHAISRRVGGGRVHREKPGAAGKADPPFRRRPPREHDSGRGEGRRIRESFDARQHYLFPDGRWRVPRLRRRQRQGGLLPRQLHARLELRNGHAAPVPQLCAIAARGGLRLRPGRRGRDAFPAVAAARQGAVRLRGGRRADGPDHARVPGLGALRRYGLAEGTLAAHQEGPGVRLGARRLGRR